MNRIMRFCLQGSELEFHSGEMQVNAPTSSRSFRTTECIIIYNKQNVSSLIPFAMNEILGLFYSVLFPTLISIIVLVANIINETIH